MIWLYRLGFPWVILAASPYYGWRMRRRGGYRDSRRQRLGGHPRLGPKPPSVLRAWVQAVSVGEVLAIGRLLEGLRRDGVEVYLTTTTSTGYRIANDRYRNLTVGIGYFPIDWWFFSARAWRRIAPDLAILTEGERWPEHVRQARERGVPVLNINARLSDRSYRRLRFLRRLAPPVVRLLFDGVTRLLPCSAQDEERFAELGISTDRLRTTGNIKLDVEIPRMDEPEKERLRAELGLPAGLVLIGASTWTGEEAALLAALQAIRGDGVRCSLLLVPRHSERRFDVEQILRKSGLRFHLRSRGPSPAKVDVAVGDTTGELRKFLQLGDLVFVGKSLPPHTEGQTPVEAAVLEKPILFGPGMGNFALIARQLVARGAARTVADPAALSSEAAELMRDAGSRNALAAAASAWHRENGGAVDRTLALIREELAGMARCRRP